MEILTTRKNQRILYNNVISLDPEAFVISHEPQHFRGGFWVKSMRKYYKEHGELFKQPFEEEIMPGVDEQTIAEINSTLDADKNNN